MYSSSTSEDDLYSYTPKGSEEISSASSEDDSPIHPRHSKRRNNLSEGSETNASKKRSQRAVEKILVIKMRVQH